MKERGRPDGQLKPFHVRSRKFLYIVERDEVVI